MDSPVNVSSDKAGLLSKLIVLFLVISFIAQYNLWFSYHFLWKTYWTGLSIRIGISLTFGLIGIFICLIRSKFEIIVGRWILVPLFFFIYGIALGVIHDHNIKYLISDSLGYLEIIFYGFLFFSLSQES